MTVYTGGFKTDPADVRSLRGAITYVAGTTGAIGSTPLFTVTGDVAIQWIAAKCTTNLTSAGAPTWTLGVTGATACFQGTMPDVTGWNSGEWADSGVTGYTAGSGISMSLASAIPYGISGAQILQTIGVATITAGVVRWYLSYIPLSGDGLVTLHSNLVAF